MPPKTPSAIGCSEVLGRSKEHYLRHSRARSFNMRQRLAQALGEVSVRDAVNRVLRVGDRPARRSDKQQGLEDGVALP